jgi:CheY-like chemotaxis protein
MLPLKGVSFLYVDADADSRDLFTLAIEQEGAKAIAVASVEEALEVLASFKPTFLVTELMLPESSGYILPLLAKRDPRQHFLAVALTTQSQSPCKNKAIAAGFKSFLTKPIDIDELAAHFIYLLEQHLSQFEMVAH